MIAVHLLSPQEARARRAELAYLLVDSVQNGGAVNFVWPMTQAKADAWWDSTLVSHDAGERLIFMAETSNPLFLST